MPFVFDSGQGSGFPGCTLQTFSRSAICSDLLLLGEDRFHLGSEPCTIETSSLVMSPDEDEEDDPARVSEPCMRKAVHRSSSRTDIHAAGSSAQTSWWAGKVQIWLATA